MVRFLKYWLFVFFLYQGNLVFAQEEAAFTIFSTGNVYGEKSEAALLNQWRNRIGMQKNFSVLLAVGEIQQPCFLPRGS